MSEKTSLLSEPPQPPDLHSRRSLERDLAGFVAGYSLARVLHALVEICYRRAGEQDMYLDWSLHDGWTTAARMLTIAEDATARLDLGP